MLIARWSKTLVKISRNLSEKEGRDLIVEILEIFDNGGQK